MNGLDWIGMIGSYVFLFQNLLFLLISDLVHGFAIVLKQ